MRGTFPKAVKVMAKTQALLRFPDETDYRGEWIIPEKSQPALVYQSIISPNSSPNLTLTVDGTSVRLHFPKESPILRELVDFHRKPATSFDFQADWMFVHETLTETWRITSQKAVKENSSGWMDVKHFGIKGG